MTFYIVFKSLFCLIYRILFFDFLIYFLWNGFVLIILPSEFLYHSILLNNTVFNNNLIRFLRFLLIYYVSISIFLILALIKFFTEFEAHFIIWEINWVWFKIGGDWLNEWWLCLFYINKGNLVIFNNLCRWFEKCLSL